MWNLGACLVALGASAQTSVPSRHAEMQVNVGARAREQLEALLLCKKGTTFAAANVESQFQALGLLKGPDDVYLPSRSDPKPSLFGDAVLAALVNDMDGEKKIAVYLKNQTGKQMARTLGVSRVDEQANTDDISYFNPTGKKTTLLVSAASELPVGASVVKFNSAVVCQVIK